MKITRDIIDYTSLAIALVGCALSFLGGYKDAGFVVMLSAIVGKFVARYLLAKKNKKKVESDNLGDFVDGGSQGG